MCKKIKYIDWRGKVLSEPVDKFDYEPFINLAGETKEFIEDNGFSIQDVEGVVINNKSCSWNEFFRLADLYYDNGFAGPWINMKLIIVGKDWWIERHEYDGKEWWEFKKLPQIPRSPIGPMELSDLVSNSVCTVV